MARRSAPLGAAALALLLLAAGPATAQANKPKPTKEQVDVVAFRLKVLISALQSDKINPGMKSALFGCIYDNSMSKISETIDKVVAANAGKINKTDPNQMVQVMSAVCGYKPAPGAPGTPPSLAKPPAKNGR